MGLKTLAARQARTFPAKAGNADNSVCCFVLCTRELWNYYLIGPLETVKTKTRYANYSEFISIKSTMIHTSSAIWRAAMIFGLETMELRKRDVLETKPGRPDWVGHVQRRDSGYISGTWQAGAQKEKQRGDEVTWCKKRECRASKG